MIELLQRLIIGHLHKWIREETVGVVSSDGDALAGKIIIMQCDVCGKLKNHKVKW